MDREERREDCPDAAALLLSVPERSATLYKEEALEPRTGVEAAEVELEPEVVCMPLATAATRA